MNTISILNTKVKYIKLIFQAYFCHVHILNFRKKDDMLSCSCCIMLALLVYPHLSNHSRFWSLEWSFYESFIPYAFWWDFLLIILQLICSWVAASDELWGWIILWLWPFFSSFSSYSFHLCTLNHIMSIHFAALKTQFYSLFLWCLLNQYCNFFILKYHVRGGLILVLLLFSLWT